MKVSSCSIVGLRNSGAVSRTKSFQNWPGASGRRLELHQRLLEALRLERAGERLLDHEDDARATLEQHLADADAVVRRPEGAFREEDDGATHFAASSRSACRLVGADGRASRARAS